MRLFGPLVRIPDCKYAVYIRSTGLVPMFPVDALTIKVAHIMEWLDGLERSFKA